MVVHEPEREVRTPFVEVVCASVLLGSSKVFIIVGFHFAFSFLCVCVQN
jgi:hypothetical protein